MHTSGRCDPDGFGRNTGLLFLLKRKAFQDPRFLDINPGRLALVQATHRDTQIPVSIVGIYQHVWRTHLTSSRNRELRQTIWAQLDTALHRIPSRHALLICGDFNSTLTCEPPLVGSAVPKCSSHTEDGLQALLYKHSLCALNTWHCKPHCTYHSSSGQTQIDYVLSRCTDTGHHARTAYPDHAFPVGSDRLNGHFPIRVSYPIRPFSWRRTRPTQTPAYNAQALCSAVRSGAPLAQELQHRVSLRLQDVDASVLSTAHQHVNRILLEETCTLFPAQPAPDHRVSAQPAFRVTARAVWGLYHAFKRSGVCTFRNIFAKWRLATQFARASKALRQSSQQLKKQFFQGQVEDAELAASRGDQRGLHLIVRRLSPHTRQLAGRLRDDSGRLLTRDEELEAIIQYGNATFAKHHDDHPILPLAQDVVIPAADLAAELSKLGPAKAVPKHIAPSAVWKLCSSDLGEVLSHALTRHLRRGTSAPLDTDWKDCSVVWIPKPNKPPQGISSLRPIGLSSPASKALAGSLRTQLLGALAPWLSCMPQFAYTSSRGTADAIAKAHRHFEEVTELVSRTRATRFQQQAGQKTRGCAGGISLSLDLSKAFDGVTRSHIYQEMKKQGVDSSVITIVQQLHHRARYIYRVGDSQGSTLTTNGIKQGCVIAPYLWNFFSLAFLLLLRDQRDLSWIQRVLSLFADDAWGAWVIASAADFQQALADITLILETLESLHMIVNFDKTAILLHLVGKESKKLRRNHTFMKAGQLHLRLWVHGREQAIPIRDQHVYLGTIVTYHSRLERNMEHRIKAARANYQGLRKLLNGAHALDTDHRIRLWKACVCSSVMYSQHVVGVTAKTLRRLTTVLTRHLRAILRVPAHLTHITNQAVWHQAGQPMPGWTVQCALLQHQAKLQQTAASGTDITSTPQALAHVDVLAGRLEALLLEAAQTLATEAVSAPSISCPHCSELFISENAVRIHCKLKHGQLPPRLNHHPTEFVPELHSTAGMPACRLCQRQFFRWSHLKLHIETGACAALGGDSMIRAPPSEAHAPAPIKPPPTAGLAVFAEENVMHLPLIKRQAFLASLGNWEKWLSVPELRQELKNYCAICHMWVADYRHMKQHYNRIHGPNNPTLLPRALDLCTSFKSHLRRDSSCIWCGHRVGAPKRHTQQCTPLVQLILAVLHCQDVWGSTDDGRLCPRGGRDLCQPMDRARALPGGRPLSEAPETGATPLEHAASTATEPAASPRRPAPITADASTPESHQPARPSCPAAGGHHQPLAQRQELRVVPAQRRQRHAGHAHAHLSRLEGQEVPGAGAAQIPSSHGAHSLHDPRAHEPGPAGGSNGGGAQQARHLGMAQFGGELELPPMESGRAPAGSRQDPLASATHGGRTSTQLSPEVHDGRHRAALCSVQNSQLPRAAGSPGRHLPSGNLFARFPGARSVRCPGPLHGQHGDESHRSFDETGHHATLSSGQEACGAGLPEPSRPAPPSEVNSSESAAAPSVPLIEAAAAPTSSVPHLPLPRVRLQGGLNSCYLNSFLYLLAAALSACKQQHLLPQAFWDKSGKPLWAARLMGFKLLG